MKKIESKQRVLSFHRAGSKGSIRVSLDLSPEIAGSLGAFNKEGHKSVTVIRYDTCIVIAQAEKEPTPEELSQIELDVKAIKNPLLKQIKDSIEILNIILKTLEK
jgi:hypothetical protein